MNLANLIDGTSALVVCGGTLLATVLRCGPGNCATAIGALAGLWRSGFDADATRAEMAVQVRDIEKGGVLRAEPPRTGDRAFDEAAGALIGSRSVKALLAAHEAHKARRMEAARRAVSTLAQSAELAPVFGLAGTLLSLSQLPAGGLAKGAFAGAISMAVLTTLYGLLLANLVLAPLARMVERKAAEEEAERQRIVDWLAGHLERTLPPQRQRPRPVPLEDVA